MSSDITASPSEVSEEDLSVITFADAALCFFALCLAAFITSANATTVVVIWRTTALRTLANTYVCSLACVDFVVGLMCVLMAMFMLPPVKEEVFYRYINVCSLFQGLIIGMALLSVIHMTLISIDRYLYIIKPYFYQRVINIRVIFFFIGMAWFVGLTISFLPQFVAKPYGPVPVCDVTERQPVWYAFYLTVCVYSVLCVIIMIMYTIILHAAGKQRKAVRANVPVYGQQDKTTEGSTNITKGTMKSIKYFLTVFGLFFACGTPTMIAIGLDYFYEIPDQLYRFVNLITLSNSGMNFIVYAVMNSQFREALLKSSVLGRCQNSPACRCLRAGDDKAGGERSKRNVSF